MYERTLPGRLRYLLHKLVRRSQGEIEIIEEAAKTIEELQKPSLYLEPESDETAKTIDEMVAMCSPGDVVKVIPMREFPEIYIIVPKEGEEVEVFDTLIAAEAARRV
jgi:hypothetical protein